ncbi:MAG: hypothetical protein Q7N50_10070, partial [Armatimonadota bacterium]|nr:hypothetical protein [Armatimonadota bacterium]
ASDFVGNASPEHPSRVKHLRLIRQLAVEVKGKCLTPTPSTINVACTPNNRISLTKNACLVIMARGAGWPLQANGLVRTLVTTPVVSADSDGRFGKFVTRSDSPFREARFFSNNRLIRAGNTLGQ